MNTIALVRRFRPYSRPPFSDAAAPESYAANYREAVKAGLTPTICFHWKKSLCRLHARRMRSRRVPGPVTGRRVFSADSLRLLDLFSNSQIRNLLNGSNQWQLKEGGPINLEHY